MRKLGISSSFCQMVEQSMRTTQIVCYWCSVLQVWIEVRILSANINMEVFSGRGTGQAYLAATQSCQP